MSDGIFDLMDYSIGGMEAKDGDDSINELMEVVDKFFVDLNTDSEYEQSQYGGEIEHGFHASAVCYSTCPRKLVYEYNGVKPEDGGISAITRRVFDNGHNVHDRWQTYFTMMSVKYPDKIALLGDWKCKGCGLKYSPTVEKEYPLYEGKIAPCPACRSTRWKYNEFRLKDDKLRMVGKRDGRFVLKTSGKNLLLEIKSMNANQFNFLKKPTDAHVKQFCFYMKMSGVTEGLFLYENKNDQDIKLFHQKYDEKLIKNELELLRIANLHIDNGSVPDRLIGYPTNKDCKKCPFKKTCKA